MEQISVGTTISEVNSIILIAEEQGYFADNGIDLTHEIYASGVTAVDAMLRGEVDIATGSEYAFAGQILLNQDIRTMSVIDRSSIEYLLARIDSGISSIADLKGKTIGVPLKSRPEFSLDRFLFMRGIDASDVTLVNVPVNQSVNALLSGAVDAVTTWQPYVDQIKTQMGKELTIWSTQEEQPSFTLVMCTGAWTKQNPKLAERFLESLVQAENYMLQHRDTSRDTIQQQLNYSEEYVASVWPDHHFMISLEQSLILAMEDEARWMISNGLTVEKQVPNFVKYIYADSLETVKPEAVTIIR